MERRTLASWLEVPISSARPFKASGGIYTASTLGGKNIIVPPNTSPNSFSSTNWAFVQQPGYDNYWVAEISTIGYVDICINSTQKANDKSPNQFALEYNIDGNNWITIENYTIRNINQPSSTVKKFDNFMLPVAVENQPKVLIRWRSTSNVPGKIDPTLDPPLTVPDNAASILENVSFTGVEPSTNVLEE